MVVTAKRECEVKRKAEASLDIIFKWLESVGLKVAVEKTCLLLAGRRKLEDITLDIKGQRIGTVREAKYLGEWLDSGGTFIRHSKEASEKALRSGMALSRIMRNVGGPSEGKRRLLCNVVLSILLYGVESWGEVIRFGVATKYMGRVHRMVSLRISRAYRTVSSDALAVIACVPPIDLQIKRKLRIINGTPIAVADDELLNSWQSRWEQSDRGRWTFNLIKDIKTWMKKKHGSLSFELTQILTGHGSFGSYLHKIGKGQPECVYCGMSDHAEHVLLECVRWNGAREALVTVIGRFTIHNLINLMTTSKDGWEAVEEFARITMARKLQDENGHP